MKTLYQVWSVVCVSILVLNFSAAQKKAEISLFQRPLYLNIIWHQHQPLYLDPAKDQLQGPWVRTHATKDYYDMAALVGQYPKIHCTINLTSSLLYQLDEYYVKRLRPFVDVNKNTIDDRRFLKELQGKTDLWIDLALRPTSTFTKEDRAVLLSNPWNAFGISDVMINRFPEYKALRTKFQESGASAMTEQDLREVKFWFFLAHMDPDFLNGRVTLVNTLTVDLTDLVACEADNTYRLKRKVTEEDCQRMVVESYKIMSAIIPVHKKLMYDYERHTGQVEVITTAFYHPILPLIYDTDLEKICQPNDPVPSRFHFPQDAEAQVAKAVEFYKKLFGRAPTGMWPAEGSVAQDVLPIFQKNGIRWVATDEKVLAHSKPTNQPKYYPYAAGGQGKEDAVAVVFRDTEISDKIGFTYQNFTGDSAATDFINSILRCAPKEGEPDRLLTVILDGENAWENYKYDIDGKQFLNAMYGKLSQLDVSGEVKTVTVTEFLQGNPERNIAAHSISSIPKLEWLWPGSWINANYDTWIGEREENKAWEYLLTTRNDLEKSGLKAPNPQQSEPKKNTKEWYAYKAWESMYAAEGSDWFWWYGDDQTAPGGDKPFDDAYLTLINNVYQFARQAGAFMPKRNYTPIITETSSSSAESQGTMAQSKKEMVTVMFQVDASKVQVPKAIYIVGNQPTLGNWKPNSIRMYDDGTHGDLKKGDGIWTLEFQFPAGTKLEYKYTNSGDEGSWVPSEEFPSNNRELTVGSSSDEKQIQRDLFGVK